MSEHDLEKLLGGFSADTLTAEEKQRLYSAALANQQLFNALADEQALKELLADPIVRHRLLQALKQTAPSRSSGLLSWLDWFRQPASIAYAGGLAAAVFTVVLGTKIYNDSLKQIAPSIATEEPMPAASPVPEPSGSQPPEPVEPQPKIKEDELPASEHTKKDGFADRMVQREQPRPSKPDKQRASSANKEPREQRTEQDKVGRQADAPLIGKTADESTSSADQKRVETAVSPLAVPEASQPMQAPAVESAGGVTARIVSARALFYAAEPDRLDQKMTEAEREQNMKSAPEARRSLRPESKMERFAAAGAPSPLKPLGLRYGFAVRTTDGTAQGTDAATALKSGEQARLTIEVNQEAYVQIWKTAGSSTPQLWFPTKETGQISMKVPAGRRQAIPLTEVSETFTLIVRLSRVPFGPITEQEAATLSTPSNQLQETITPQLATGSQEQATYVVNQNLSPTVQLIVEIPLGR